jgi:hypothetical protein
MGRFCLPTGPKEQFYVILTEKNQKTIAECLAPS